MFILGAVIVTLGDLAQFTLENNSKSKTFQIMLEIEKKTCENSCAIFSKTVSTIKLF